MSQIARKFVPRAPRYVLRPSDRHIIRYSAGDNTYGSIHSTALLNLSESGMAIEMEMDQCPRVGEQLKVELPVPGGEQIAWFARVVRTQIRQAAWWASHASPESDKVIVALRFDNLPKGHVEAIRKGLNERFLEELRERRARQLLYLHSIWIQNTWKIVGYLIGIAVVSAILYLLARPTANYDPAKGTGWGERFQFFSFEKQK